MKTEGNASKLSPKQHLALPLIISGMSSVEVSAQIGVQPSTVSEWLHHSHAFKGAMKKIRQESMELTKHRVDSLAADALTELGKILATSASEATRLKACEIVISKLLPQQPPADSGGLDMRMFGGPLD